MYDNKNQVQIFTHNSEITDVKFRPDGKQLISSSFRGNMTVWDINLGQITEQMECQRDIIGGRGQFDHQTAKN